MTAKLVRKTGCSHISGSHTHSPSPSPTSPPPPPREAKSALSSDDAIDAFPLAEKEERVALRDSRGGPSSSWWSCSCAYVFVCLGGGQSVRDRAAAFVVLCVWSRVGQRMTSKCKYVYTCIHPFRSSKRAIAITIHAPMLRAATFPPPLLTPLPLLPCCFAMPGGGGCGRGPSRRAGVWCMMGQRRRDLCVYDEDSVRMCGNVYVRRTKREKAECRPASVRTPAVASAPHLWWVPMRRGTAAAGRHRLPTPSRGLGPFALCSRSPQPHMEGRRRMMGGRSHPPQMMVVGGEKKKCAGGGRGPCPAGCGRTLGHRGRWLGPVVCVGGKGVCERGAEGDTEEREMWKYVCVSVG